MRLTLRTLLAHKDGVLDRSDAEILEGKIRASQFATSLRERMETCVRRRHLAAPPVDGRGLGADPNSVAEYLDNTLEQERIPEFEKICLESDVQLAEVTACHQILSIVLEQPATVSAALRKRILELENADSRGLASAGVDLKRRGASYTRMDRGHTQVDQDPVTATTESLQGDVRASQHPDTIRKQGIDLSNQELTSRVPEYLRGRTSTLWKQVAITVVLLALLITLSINTIGSWDQLKSLLSASATSDTSPEKSDGSSQTAKVLPAPPDSVKPGIANAKPSTVQERKNEPTESVTPSNPSEQPSNNDETSSKSVPTPDVTGTNGVKPFAVQWMPETREAKESVLFWVNPKQPGNPVLCAVNERIESGMRLLVPPAYRTQVRFAPGIRWTVCGPTDLQILEPQSKIARIALKRGRAFLEGTEDANAMEIALDDVRSVRIELAQPTSTAGIELRYFTTPGQSIGEPASTSSVFQVMALENELRCQILVRGVPEGAPIPVPFGSVLGWVEGNPPSLYPMPFVPTWIQNTSPRPIDAIAARDLYMSLGSIAPESIVAELQKLSKSRRPETAAMAVRTLCLLGDYKAFVAPENVLAIPQLRAHWDVMLEDAVASLQSDRSRLASFREGWDRTYGDKSEYYWSLLFGLSQEQLASGSDKLLVESLASANLEHRVLGLRALKQIVESDMEYLADRPSPESMQAIRKMLAANKIRYRTLPTPLPESSKLPVPNGSPQ